ncbi:ParB/RepB/Spo0J family partition protein [Luteipulveratus sp. YIM 133132]|uniref:ParB/RepB/Spo0J family partition protein n=1 Tax=Luteipulveratus flavus TaxID=3031728 RepID=UPI0023AEC365|nr:ParB/RepB/Spo0J family partition protein [Luteipulveratus sp. YIM 133132]MDE9364560.1 ParB/RepB/Spo0J family partition protein [Luteipulveratus sp. YIM 133132]
MITLDEVAPALVRPHPKNPRHQLGDLTDLTASIKQQGVIEPLVVEPVEDPKPNRPRYQLISGHRRLAAAKRAKVKTVPVIVRDPHDLGEQIESMLVENLQRADLTVVEEGDAYQALLDLPGGAYTQAKIAQRVGRSKKTVAERVKVAKLPESARDRILSGQLTLEDGVAVAEFAGDTAALERIEKAAASGSWSLRHALDQERERRRADREAVKLRREATKADRPVFDTYDAAEDAADDLYDLLVLGEHWTEAEWDKVDEDADGYDEQAAEDDMQRRQTAWQSEHLQCPGHALVVESATAVVPVCLDAHRHHPDLFPAGTHADTPARPESPLTPTTPAVDEEQDRARRDADRKARAEHELELRAAAHTRRAYVADVISQPAKDLEGMAKQMLLRGFDYLLGRDARNNVALRTLAEVLLPNATDEALDRSDLAERVKKALEKLNSTQLAVLASLRVGLSWDHGLEQADRWAWGPSGGTADWRKVLTDTLGYEWTPAEQKALDDAAGEQS